MIWLRLTSLLWCAAALIYAVLGNWSLAALDAAIASAYSLSWWD